MSVKLYIADIEVICRPPEKSRLRIVKTFHELYPVLLDENSRIPQHSYHRTIKKLLTKKGKKECLIEEKNWNRYSITYKLSNVKFSSECRQ